MKVLHMKEIKESRKNILISLEYLRNEAQIGGYEELYSILDRALNSAKNRSTMPNLKLEDIASNICDHQVIELLIRFKQAPTETQRDILETLELLGTEEHPPTNDIFYN